MEVANFPYKHPKWCSVLTLFLYFIIIASVLRENSGVLSLTLWRLCEDQQWITSIIVLLVQGMEAKVLTAGSEDSNTKLHVADCPTYSV